MIVTKAVKMAQMMNIPILGLVENYSYLECPDCGRRISVFGESKIETVAKEQSIKTYSSIPIKPEIASLVDSGRISELEAPWLENMLDTIFSLQK